jgi:hypothetical protein
VTREVARQAEQSSPLLGRLADVRTVASRFALLATLEASTLMNKTRVNKTRMLANATVIAASALALGCNTSEVSQQELPVSDAPRDGGSSTRDASMRDASLGVAPSAQDASPGGEQAPASQAPTYTAHVRPILARACVSCHSEGQIAPFTLVDYESVKPFASRIAKVTRARTMPPSVIDASGACNSFRDIAWLSEDELTTLEQWSEAGAPEGDRALATPAPRQLPTLDGTVTSVQTPDYVPDTTEPDEYRCFVVESPFKEPAFVTGYNTVPGNLKVSHHMVVFYPMDDGSAVLARLLDELDPGPGYHCPGSAQVPATVLAAWAPGAGATNLPDGLGFEVVPGRPVVVQMHYNTLGQANITPDSTRVEFETTKQGVTPARFVNLLDVGMSAAPGQAEAEVVISKTIAEKVAGATGTAEIYGMFPHMHELGRQIRVSIGDDEECVLDAPRYEFAWQRMYFLQEPLKVDVNATIKLRCLFDTTSRTEPVTWGEGTQDEMCVTGLIVKL